MVRNALSGLTRKVSTILTTGALGLGFANMSGCEGGGLGALLAAAGSVSQDPQMAAAMSAAAPWVSNMEAAEIQRRGAIEAARTRNEGKRNVNTSRTQNSTTLFTNSFDPNKPFFFSSDSDWIDMNGNRWFEYNEFGNIKNSFKIGESVYLHLCIPDTRTPNGWLRLTVTDPRTSETEEHISQLLGRGLFYNTVELSPIAYDMEEFREEVEKYGYAITSLKMDYGSKWGEEYFRDLDIGSLNISWIPH